jgi:sortase A
MNPDELTPPELRNPNDAAVDLIRSKLDALYSEEPNAEEEIEEINNKTSSTLSKHQRFMDRLRQSGKDMAQIQTEWHEYYQNLADREKHEVWQEFYSEHAVAKQQKIAQNEGPTHQPRPIVSHNTEQMRRKRSDKRKPDDIKSQILSTINTQGIKDNHHVRSIVFGLSMGFTVIFILLFSFFNERFITPFIRPSMNVSATPIIVDPNTGGPVSPEPKIIIPKINLEAPVVYDVQTINEKDIQAGLEKGVVHYITTPNPGEKGNSVIFGHSSSNILNKGKYKFAFLLLKSLDKDDTFIIQKDGKKYVYKVYNKYVTTPDDISVLGPTDKPSTMTLITCDPPGTSTNRLIIQAEQIFPDPSVNKDSTAKNVGTPSKVPSNSQSLWQRLFGRD